jgi:Tol biopolymer transport system component
MAYTSDESGQNQVYVRPFPEVEGGRWQVSTSGGDSPPWSPDGKRFLMMKETGATTSSDEGPRKINIVLNWFEELKQRVPVK